MLASLAVFALVTYLEPPQRKVPPTEAELAAITKRGRELAGYDAASWHASDAVQAKAPREGSVVRYIARRGDRGWVVAFGKPDEKGEAFLIAYEATQAGEPDAFDVKAHQPPVRDTGFFLSASRAIDSALEDFTANFQGKPRPYNVAVLPAEAGRLWVYLVPAPTRAGVWPLGDDVRYLVSADGTKIESKRQLHKAVIESEPPRGENQKPVGGVHSHVLDDVPEDTDVFHVLTRKPSVPEMVVTKPFVFAVELDGRIRFVGRSEEVLKKP